MVICMAAIRFVTCLALNMLIEAQSGREGERERERCVSVRCASQVEMTSALSAVVVVFSALFDYE